MPWTWGHAGHIYLCMVPDGLLANLKCTTAGGQETQHLAVSMEVVAAASTSKWWVHTCVQDTCSHCRWQGMRFETASSGVSLYGDVQRKSSRTLHASDKARAPPHAIAWSVLEQVVQCGRF